MDEKLLKSNGWKMETHGLWIRSTKVKLQQFKDEGFGVHSGFRQIKLEYQLELDYHKNQWWLLLVTKPRDKYEQSDVIGQVKINELNLNLVYNPTEPNKIVEKYNSIFNTLATLDYLK